MALILVSKALKSSNKSSQSTYV